MLKDRITRIINFACKVAESGKINDPEFVRRFIATHEINLLIKGDFMSKNPDEMTDEYTDYIESLNLSTYLVKKGSIYYRARAGYEVLHGSVDDYNRDFYMPYHGKNIEAPPPLLSAGARFNREGTSYLYLADDIDTCIAEIQAQINQVCSVGKFESQEDIELIDLRIEKDLESSIFIGLLTQPINNDNHNEYNVTRFLSEILRTINPNGMIFKSVQSKGNNIVCFQRKVFSPIKFSQKLYRVKKIMYETEKTNSAIEEFANKLEGSYGSILSINDDWEKANEEKFDYLNDWIEHERSTRA